MRSQRTRSLRLTGLSFGLLLSASCGNEREPWNGFALFPPEPPMSDAGTLQDAATAETSQSPGTTSQSTENPRDTPIATGSATPPTAAGSGGAGPITEQTAPGVDTATAGAPPTTVQPDAPPMAFRITELQLRDPHIFAGTMDLTDSDLLGQSVNKTLIPAKLTKDADGDGALDVSVIVLLKPYDPTAAPEQSPTLDMVDARCPVNSTSGPCTPLKATAGLQTSWTVEQRQSGSCLAPTPGTTSDYQPPITVPSGPCFLSTTGNDLTMDLGGIKIDVIDARISATYQSQSPALTHGLLAGFVTRAAAMRAKLPSDAGPVVAGDSLSTYIRMRDYDQSASPNGEDGFWIYMNFTAKPIDYAP